MIVDSLEQAWRAWASLGNDLDEHEWHRPTRLPGWTVKCVYAHHSPFPAQVIAALRAPDLSIEVTFADAAELLSSMQRPGGRADEIADVLRSVAIQRASEIANADLIREFTEVGEQAIAGLRDYAMDTKVDYGGFGVVTAGEALRIFVLEAVVHYFDIASALDREIPGPMAGEPLRETVRLLAETADPVTLIDVATGRSRRAVFPIMR